LIILCILFYKCLVVDIVGWSLFWSI